MLYKSMSEDQIAHGEVRTLLASNLHRLRIARRLSLSELARATGISKATLSGIEHARGNPTIDTIAALAGALRISLSELLEPQPLGEVHIVRGASLEPASREDVGLRVLEILELRGQAEVFELSLPPHHVHQVKPRASRSRTHMLVLQGRLIAGPVERISELVAGDYASFPADVQHVFESTRVLARALVVAHTPA